MALTLQIKVETSSQRVSGELQITEKFIYLLNTSRTISQVQLRHVGVVLWRTSSSAPEHAHTVLPEPTRNQKSHADKLQHGASGTLQSVKCQSHNVTLSYWSKNSEEVLSDQRNGSGRLTVCSLLPVLFLWSNFTVFTATEQTSVEQITVLLTSNRPDRRNRSGCRGGRHHIHTPGRVQSGRRHLEETHRRQTDSGVFKNCLYLNEWCSDLSQIDVINTSLSVEIYIIHFWIESVFDSWQIDAFILLLHRCSSEQYKVLKAQTAVVSDWKSTRLEVFVPKIQTAVFTVKVWVNLDVQEGWSQVSDVIKVMIINSLCFIRFRHKNYLLTFSKGS